MDDQTEKFFDEVSINDVIIKLWKRRGLILILPVLSGLLAVASVLLMATQSINPMIHFVSLTGVTNGEYPNGVKFSPLDLKSSEVLINVANKFGLNDYDALSEAIDVTFGAPTNVGIIKKYQVKLSQNKLKVAEIDQINEQFNEELSNATEKTAKIAIDYQSIGIDEGLAAQIALTLPLSWAEVFTKKFRILDNPKLSGISQIQEINLRTPSNIIEASDYLANMLDGLEIIENDSRLSGLQTDSGETAADLRVKVRDFNNLYLSAILSRNLSNKDELTKFYQNNFTLRIAMLTEQLNGVNETVNSIRSMISGGSNSEVEDTSFSNNRANFGGSSLTEIVDLVNKSSMTDYLTSLFQLKLEIIKERSELNLRMSKIEEEVQYSDEFLISTEQKLNKLNSKYTDILVGARQMNLQNNKTLSKSLGSPHLTGSLFPKRSILIILLSVIVGGLVAAIAALMLPKVKDT